MRHHIFEAARKRLALFFIASAVWLAISAAAQTVTLSTNNVAFNFSTFGLQPNQITSVTIQGQYWSAVPGTFYHNPPQTLSRANYPQMTNGSVVFSNQLCGVPFQVIFSGYYSTYSTNYLIPAGAATNNLGNVDAAQYVGKYGDPSHFYYAYLNGFSFATNYTVYTNNYVTTNIFQITNNITGTNVAILGRTNAIVTQSNLTFIVDVPGTPFDPAGAAQKATNGLPVFVWGLGTASQSNAAAFDTNGAARSVTNGLPALIWGLGTASQSNAAAFDTNGAAQSVTNGLPALIWGLGTASQSNAAAFDTNGAARQATNGLPVNIWMLGTASQSNAAAFDTNGAAIGSTNTPAFTRFGTNVYTSLTVLGGSLAVSTNAAGISATLTVGNQTNNFTTLVTTNPATVVYTNNPQFYLALTNPNAFDPSGSANSAATAATNGLPGGIWTLGSASQNNTGDFDAFGAAAAVTNGLPGFIWSLGTASQSNSASFDGAGAAQRATNGLPGGIWTLGTASQSNSASFDGAGVALAATNGLNTSLRAADMVVSNGAINFALTVGGWATNQGAVVSNGVGAFMAQTNAGILSASSNTAARLIGITNLATLYAITNFFGVSHLAQFNNTNTIIAATGFGTPQVNTLYFTAGNNFFVSGNGIYYFYDGVNWDFWSLTSGILYQIGGMSPIGNTFTVANGFNPAGSTFYTNSPVSQNIITVVSNTVLNVQAGGVLSGPISNSLFSAVGTNAILSLTGSNLVFAIPTNLLGFVQGPLTNNSLSIPSGSNEVYTIALAAAIAAGGPTNGVTSIVATNIASGQVSGANLVTNAATRSVTLNLGNSTNLPVLQSLSGTGFTVTYSQLPNGFSNASLTVSGGASTLAYFNNNTPAGLVTTNSTSVGIGTNALYSVLEGIADPNGTVTGIKGQYYSRFDSSGNFLFLQINTNGATGWQ